MAGCCAFEQEKFKNSSGAIEKLRLDALTEFYREAGVPDDELNEAHQCDCTCHHDGVLASANLIWEPIV
jgi:hypothetical protein